MEESVNMAERLSDVIGSFLADGNHKEISYNKYVKKNLVRTAAMVESRLRHEQVHFVDMKRAGLLDENKRRNLLIQIMELKEELEDLRCRMTSPARIEMDTETRRCVFRTISDRNATMTLIDFVRIYNKWVNASAEYLIQKTIREIVCAASRNNNSTSNPNEFNTTQAMLAKEYDKQISEQENMLCSYCEDLHDIAKKLDEEYEIFDTLDKLTDDVIFL